MARAAPSDSLQSPRATRDENDLLEALRGGDERVFTELVERWSGAMLRIANSHVGSRAVAEEDVQDAWLTVLRDLHRFEARSALRTWVLGIVINLARSRGRAERRAVPVPTDAGEPVVDPARFRPSAHPRWPGHWALAPATWSAPEESLLSTETRTVVLEAIGALPPTQREVLVLRDLEGLTASETCNVLGLSDTNQRVLLHRARSRVRNALESYFDATERA